MGDAVKRFLHATRLHCEHCCEASQMPLIPPPCQWPDSNRDAYLQREPNQDTVRARCDRAMAETGSSATVADRVVRLFEETRNLFMLARNSDVDKREYWKAYGDWSTAYEALRPYGIEAETPEPHIQQPQADHERHGLPMSIQIYGGTLSQYFAGIEKILLKCVQGSASVNDTLHAIHEIAPIPIDVSYTKLGDVLGVSRQAVAKTAWCIKNRKGRRLEHAQIRIEERKLNYRVAKRERKSGGEIDCGG